MMKLDVQRGSRHVFAPVGLIFIGRWCIMYKGAWKHVFEITVHTSPKSSNQWVNFLIGFWGPRPIGHTITHFPAETSPKIKKISMIAWFSQNKKIAQLAYKVKPDVSWRPRISIGQIFIKKFWGFKNQLEIWLTGALGEPIWSSVISKTCFQKF